MNNLKTGEIRRSSRNILTLAILRFTNNMFTELTMIVIHISIKANAESSTEFERILREVVEDARKTEGCIKYEWYRVPDVSNQFIVYGEFDSEGNFNAYLQSAVVKKVNERLIPLLEGGPEFKHYQATVLEGS